MESIFSANGRFYKQIDGVTMGGPLSVVFPGCFPNDMEEKLVHTSSPLLYIRYVKKKKNEKNYLFKVFDAFHPNIKLTFEVKISGLTPNYNIKR